MEAVVRLTVVSVSEVSRMAALVHPVRGLEVVFKEDTCTASQPGLARSQHGLTNEGRRAWRILTSLYPEAPVYDEAATDVGRCCLFVEGGSLNKMSEAKIKETVIKCASKSISLTFDPDRSEKLGENVMLAWRLGLPLLSKEYEQLGAKLPSGCKVVSLGSGDCGIGVMKSQRGGHAIDLLEQKDRLEALIRKFVAGLA